MKTGQTNDVAGDSQTSAASPLMEEAITSTWMEASRDSRYNFEHLKEWYRDREDWRIALWLNSPAKADNLAIMDQDIARLRQYAPNSPELSLLLQIRARQAEQLAKDLST